MRGSGVHFVIGITGSGKTTYVVDEVIPKLVTETGYPILCIDSEGAGEALIDGKPNPLTKIPQRPYAESIKAVARDRMHSRFHPENEEQVDAAVHVLHQKRDGAILFIDEFAYWGNHNRILPAIERLLRAHRAARIHLVATSQYVADVAPLALQCTTEATFFKVTGERAKQNIEQRFAGISGDEIEKLKRFERREWSVWGS